MWSRDRHVVQCTMGKFNYRFSTLCGCVYGKGNLLFSRDGDSVYSPVGNRITQFDLRNNKAVTFPFENRKNIHRFAISPDGVLMITVDEDGRCLLINLHRAAVLHHFNFKSVVNDIVFSPDGRLFAVTHAKKVQLWRTPGTSKDFAPFVLFREFPGQYDDAMCIGWSADSRFFVVGSRDTSCRVFSVGRIRGFHYLTLTGHRSPVLMCSFEHKSLNFCSVSKDASIVWMCSRTPDDVAEYFGKTQGELKEGVAKGGEGGISPQQEEGEGEVMDDSEGSEEEEGEEEEEEEGDDTGGGSDVDSPSAPSQRRRDRSHPRVISLSSVNSSSSENEEEEESDLEMLLPSQKKRKVNWCTWYKSKKHVFNREYSEVSCAAHHKESHLLIVGFSSGIFCLYELPDFNLIHTLSISQQKISSVAVSPSGEWLAFGCSSMGQLLVWEWQSESYVLKQQGHYYEMSCLAYSPGGDVVATGGEDGKVKLWNTLSSFCYVTFAEHSASVTGVVFGKASVVVSCSLDGTVRCFDLHRYRNFRTFTSPRPVQFSCVAVDPSGEVVCAGSQDTFEIFTWSLQTGRLLEILSGHEGPVSGLAFSPVQATLASCSWDRTLRLWSVFEERGGSDTVQLSADAVTLAWSPGGHSLAVATLDGAVVLWDAATLTQTGCIEGRQDLRPGRRTDEKVTAKQLESSVHFTSLCYSADGACLLAGGRSKFVCIYGIKQLVLLKRFQISSNQSFDGMKRFLNSANCTEAGPVELISDDEAEDRIKLPGVLKGDYSKRATKPEIHVNHLQFSPTGQAWAAVSTEGLVVYTLDSGIVFDPLDLSIDVTPETVIDAIKSHDLLTAIVLSFKLGDRKLLQKSVETVAPYDVRVIAANLPRVYLEPMVQFLAWALEGTLHVEFYLCWCGEVLTSHGSFIKDHAGSLSVALTALQKAVTVKQEELAKIAERNTSLLAFLQTAATGSALQ